MDLLSSVLRSLNVVDSAVGLFEFDEPWAFRVPAITPNQAFVLGIESGSAYLQLGEEFTVAIGPGDTAVVLGAAFVASSSPGHAGIPSETIGPELRPLDTAAREEMLHAEPVHLRRNLPLHDSEPTTTMAVLSLRLEDVAHGPMLSVLPSWFVLPRHITSVYPWTYPVHRFVRHERGRRRPGYEAAQRSLVQLTFIELVRSYAVDIGADDASWLKGIADPKIGPALALIHGEATRDWRLESLADACQMARSTFVRRFRQLVGRPPMEYLCWVRLQLAAQRLVAGHKVGDVAAEIGYQSEWAFRKAFTRQFGASPRRYAQSLKP